MRYVTSHLQESPLGHQFTDWMTMFIVSEIWGHEILFPKPLLESTHESWLEVFLEPGKKFESWFPSPVFVPEITNVVKWQGYTDFNQVEKIVDVRDKQTVIFHNSYRILLSNVAYWEDADLVPTGTVERIKNRIRDCVLKGIEVEEKNTVLISYLATPRGSIYPSGNWYDQVQCAVAPDGKYCEITDDDLVDAKDILKRVADAKCVIMSRASMNRLLGIVAKRSICDHDSSFTVPGSEYADLTGNLYRYPKL